MFSTAVPLNFLSKAAAMFSLDRERNRLNKRYARLAAPSANRKSQWRGNTRIAKHPTANPHRVAADASLVVNEAPINFQTFCIVRGLKGCQSMTLLFPSQAAAGTPLFRGAAA